MRQVIYSCAMSLDGCIAGPNGEHDWITLDPDVDFKEMFSRFDTFLIGRKTFDGMLKAGTAGQAFAGIQSIVCSRTLKPTDYPGQTICADAESVVRELQAKPGKDIALFGGGELFRSLLEAGLVDGIGIAIIPVLLGGGIPFVPSPASRATLNLEKHRVYAKTGIVRLDYAIEPTRKRHLRVY